MKKKKLKIGIMFGGRSGEHAVSMASSRSILGAIDLEKFEVVQIGITRGGEWMVGPDQTSSVWDAMDQNKTGSLHRGLFLPYPEDSSLYALNPQSAKKTFTRLADLDVVFPVLHGTFGEDGTLQGLLEMADLAYVGAGVAGASVAMDKGIFKDVMRANGVPVLGGRTESRREIEKDIESVIRRAESVSTYPLFTKPANLGSSVGITKCRSRSDLYEGLMEAAKFDRRVLIEQGLENAREIEVSVLGNDLPEASIPGEIVPAGEFYTYESKYHDEGSQLLIPAPISDEMTKTVQAYAVNAYKAIDCAGMARVDFLLDPQENTVFLNEINAIPGFTDISMYPKLWEASGLPYKALITRLIELALERKSDRDQTVRDYEWN